MTEEEKNIKQEELIHAIFESCIKDSFKDYWKNIKKLAKLREEDKYKVAFDILKSLNDENLKLIKGRTNVENN